ncbi:MAG: methylthioribulose 1-phosphate dehydratase [Myxococcales bacterium]|nr:methylthioribulose 1-phosphate dehydratase [Myxococcales bacterium]
MSPMFESHSGESPRQLVVDLCRQFYFQGWCTGTGGGISVRDGDRIYIAPSGVQKERIGTADLFVVDMEGAIIQRPANPKLGISACTPLFLNAYRLRGAGAVLHSHSINAMLATLIPGDEFQVTHLEMQKGLRGVGYHDQVRVPIVENTAHECDLADRMAEAMTDYPAADAVLVRRHGVYVWGKDWQQAKTQAECYDYLFQAAVRMRQVGVDPTLPPG